LHRMAPMNLDRLLRNAQLTGDLLVEHPGDHEPQHVALARGQSGEAPLDHNALGSFSPALPAAGEAALHAGEKLRGAEGLLQAVHGPLLHRTDTRGHVAVARHEYDGNVPPGLLEGRLEIHAARGRPPPAEDE